MILEQEGHFRIRELVVDRAETDDAMAKAARARTPSWMPEHYYSLGRPTGHVYAEGKTREELVDVMRTMEWPDTW